MVPSEALEIMGVKAAAAVAKAKSLCFMGFLLRVVSVSICLRSCALAKAQGLLKTHTDSEITKISGFLNFE
jgi:hypothetical protein